MVRLRPGADGAAAFNLIWQDLARLLHDLPAMPDSVRLLQDALYDNPVDLCFVGRIIRRDPALAAQIFRLSNNFVSEDGFCVTALEECLVLLGLDCLRRQLLHGSGQWPSQQMGRLEELRRHSALSAGLSRSIAETMGYPDPERVYFAGLLHDLGKFPLLLLSANPADFAAHPSPGAMVAHSGLLTDHCAFGAWLAALWKLPGFLADSIEYHHNVESAHVEPWVVKMVAAGNQMTHALLGDRNSGPGPSARDVHSFLRRLLPSLSWAQATTLQEKVDHTYACWRREQEACRCQAGGDWR